MATQAQPLRKQYRYFSSGMDSWSVPDQLGENEYVNGVNVVCRGGLVATRPGTNALFCLPTGKAQGLTLFTPATGTAHLVAAVDGYIFVSPRPFTSWRRLPNIRFNPTSRYVAFCAGLKSTDYTPEGELFFLDHPYKVLVMQDSRTRAAFWDGSESRHLNPTPSDGEVTVEGFDETRIGLWMCWSNSRLWVSRGNRVFASDLGNPLKFTEAQYLNEAPAFYLPDECTGMIEAPEQAGVLAAHAEGIDFIESSIIDRTQWLQTPNMQRTIVNIGCVAPRSLVKQHGLIYWFSPAGLVSLNEALRANQSSELIPIDQEMAWSKALIGPDLQGIACAAFENYLTVSVPYCSIYNTHTWAMDLATFERNERSWNGVWTGWRPVEWATGTVDGRQRAFFLSKDTDGQNRVWEAFLPDRQDNGCDITCSVQFRLDAIGSAERKLFHFAEIDLGQIYGEVSVMAAVAGWRGWFDRIMTKEIVASRGRIQTEQTYGNGVSYPKMGGNRPQVRTVKTAMWTNPTTCNECGVESVDQVNRDTHFQLFLGWQGRCGVLGIRLFGVDDVRPNTGGCETDEAGPKTLMASGCASSEEFPTTEAFPDFSATAEYEREDIEDIADSIHVETCARSQISQAAADRKAACAAYQLVNRLARISGLPTFNTSYGCTSIAVTAATGFLAIYLSNGTTLAPDPLDFGQLAFNDDGVTITLVLKNEGLQTLNISNISFDDVGYEFVDSLDTTELAPGESVSITLRAIVV